MIAQCFVNDCNAAVEVGQALGGDRSRARRRSLLDADDDDIPVMRHLTVKPYYAVRSHVHSQKKACYA